jgi:anti-sigma factor RsiW
MTSEKTLHAYMDGELDAAASLELEREMAQNPALRTSYERLRELSASVREKADYHSAPARFKRTTAKRSWPILAPAFASVAVVAFALGLFIARPADDAAPGADAIASHVHATLAGRSIDVASSDQHTVKPWLSARLPFSPPVTDLSSEGYELAGGRVDYIGGQQAAVLVYKRRQHVIDVFVRPDARESKMSISSRDGFNLGQFAHDGMRYWIVSDLNRNELDDFARLLASRH